MIYLAYFTIGIILATSYELLALKVFKKQALIIFGHRLHHSLYGLLFIAVGYFVLTELTFLGCGIIAQHSFTDGFKFITKESNA